MDIENMNIEKATERCNQLIKPEHTNWIGISNQKAIETVLSELEKKDKEIEKLKKDNKELLRKLRNRVKEVKKLTKYSLYKKEFLTLNEHLKKKDKIIDLMAEEISKKYYICDLDCENKCNDNYKECWKQYFENKVTDTNVRERKVENGN